MGCRIRAGSRPVLYADGVQNPLLTAVSSSHLTQLVTMIHVWRLNIQHSVEVSVTGKWIRNISVILASCGKVFLGNLAYIILMPFLFSLLRVEAIGECTEEVRYLEERGYLCPLDKMSTFSVTVLEGWTWVAVIVLLYCGVSGFLVLWLLQSTPHPFGFAPLHHHSSEEATKSLLKQCRY